MLPSRAARPVCEVDRAYRELIGRSPAETSGGSNPCSPEAPEPRSFPAARAGEKQYVLCNGHLRDLFDEQAKLSSLKSHPIPH
ncbi:MAG TPA: hypothetical protein VML94_08440 [Thermoplasmata archaeon]|nr:hypothetical protein [Thermoplasmata archaeon]